MRILLAALLIFFSLDASAEAPPKQALTFMTFPVNRNVVDADNEFIRLNPLYKQRAGAFYETEYVAPSAAKLFKVASVKDGQMQGTLDALRGFIYDWLDYDSRDNGKLTEEHRSLCVAAMDRKFKMLFDDDQYAAYEVWRKKPIEGDNLLMFLIDPNYQPAPVIEPGPQRID